ncbi:unnamed protein product [Orchesella dallaii]|uniref:Gustatory receptor n=1 Tax=Orchesella dallaii TaxID=48710 RepID=A0ABP1QCQ7_9HEXA
MYSFFSQDIYKIEQNSTNETEIIPAKSPTDNGILGQIVTWKPVLYINAALESHCITLLGINHVFLFVISSSLLGVANKYREDLARYGKDVKKGIESYRRLRTKVSQINKVFEAYIIAFVAIVIPYYCEIPDVFMKYLSEEPMPSVIFYIFLNTSVLLLAAEFNSRVNQIFSEWFNKSFLCATTLNNQHERPIMVYNTKITSYRDVLESSIQLVTIKNELHSYPVALSCRFFFVTYGFLAKLASLVMHLYTLYFQIGFVMGQYVSIREMGQDVVSQYFNFFSNVASVALLLLFYKIIWFRRGDLLTIVGLTEIKIKKADLIFSVARLLAVAAMYANTFWMYIFILQNFSEEHPEYPSETELSSKRNSTNSFTWLHIVSMKPVQHLYAIFEAHCMEIYTVNYFFLLVLGSTLLGMATNYRAKLAYHGKDIKIGIELYRDLRTKVSQINKLFEVHLIVFTAVIIPLYCGIPDVLMNYLSDEPIGLVTFYGMVNTSIFVFAAEFNSQVKQNNN